MRVVVVDDDRLVCASLKTILEVEQDIAVVGVGYNGEEAIELYRALKPDILLMDIRMEPMTGLVAAEVILREHREGRILFLTTFSDDEYVIKALRLGAKGYLIKQNFESIVPSLRAVEMGQNVYGDELINKLPYLMSQSKVANLGNCGITEKEQELIQLVAEGLNNREIAGRLYLSEGTVRNSLSVVLDKLDLRDRTQLAIFYYKTREQHR